MAVRLRIITINIINGIQRICDLRAYLEGGDNKLFLSKIKAIHVWEKTAINNVPRNKQISLQYSTP